MKSLVFVKIWQQTLNPKFAIWSVSSDVVDYQQGCLFYNYKIMTVGARDSHFFFGETGKIKEKPQFLNLVSVTSTILELCKPGISLKCHKNYN